METTSRRGFLGFLAGLVLGGKVLGPKVIAAPTPEIWRKARRLPPFPIGNTFIPLQSIATQTIQVIARELRAPFRYQPQVDIDWRKDPLCLRERLVMSQLTHHIHAPMLREREIDWEMPWELFSPRYVEPLGCAMAEHIIRDIRSSGGAGMVVVPSLEPLLAVKRSVVATNDDLGLSVRANHFFDPDLGEMRVGLDMVYGLVK